MRADFRQNVPRNTGFRHNRQEASGFVKARPGKTFSAKRAPGDYSNIVSFVTDRLQP